jgi:nucleoside-diphosphate-sugar epimerase
LRKVLVTGGAGSLGLILSKALHEGGYQGRVFDIPQCDYSYLESLDGLEIVRGDIREEANIEQVLKNVDIIFHLAALLPPSSEKNRETTWDINVKGTERLLNLASRSNNRTQLVFASSVSTYGDTSEEKPPLTVNRPQRPLDIYAESKIAAEKLVLASSLSWTILRISGIAVPAFLDPPEVWPFMADQRIEFIALPDLVTCLVNLVGKKEAQGKIMNIAGGPSWQVKGRAYVERFCQTMDLPLDQAVFYSTPGWLDWYDTRESQQLFQYQNTSFDQFHQLLAKAVEDALEG